METERIEVIQEPLKAELESVRFALSRRFKAIGSGNRTEHGIASSLESLRRRSPKFTASGE
jgi:hypothetical protein